ncbi:MAG: hypothetical protein R6W82_07785 [bacterium]
MEPAHYPRAWRRIRRLPGDLAPWSGALIAQIARIQQGESVEGDLCQIGGASLRSAALLGYLQLPGQEVVRICGADRVLSEQGILKEVGRALPPDSTLEIVRKPAYDLTTADTSATARILLVTGAASAEEAYTRTEIASSGLHLMGFAAVAGAFDADRPSVAEGLLALLRDHPERIVPFAVGLGWTFLAPPETAEFYRTALEEERGPLPFLPEGLFRREPEFLAGARLVRFFPAPDLVSEERHLLRLSRPRLARLLGR